MNIQLLRAMGGLGGGGSTEKLITLFEIPDLTVVSGGNFVGSGTPIQAATTTVANDSLVMPANNTAIIASLTLAGCYSQFYTNDTTPKTVLLSDIYLTNDQVIKSGNYLALLPNAFQRNLISTLYDSKSLKRSTVNLLNDPAFSETSKLADRTTGKLIWWTENTPFAGASGASIQYYNDTVLLDGRRYYYVGLTTGTAAATPSTRIVSRIYFSDYQIKTTDKISISTYIKTATANGGLLTYLFYDRNGNAIGTKSVLNVGNLSNVWSLRKVENISIPASTYGVLYVEFSLEANNGNTTVYVTQPCVNVGATALQFENSYSEYSNYTGLQRFISKCLAGEAVEVEVHGDSLTRSTDTSQTHKLSPLTAFLGSEFTRLFGNVVTIRNNAADGSNHLLQHSILKKMTVAHNPDLVFLMSGRNTENTDDEILSKYIVEETDITSILSNDLTTDIVVSLPFFRKHSNPIAETEIPYYTKDLSFVNQNAALKTRYKISNIYSAQKIKAFCDLENTTMTWDLMYNPDNVHLQSGGGHFIRQREISYLIANALRYAAARTALAQPINVILPLNAVTYYPSQFGVSENTVKSGTWINDANVTMNGTSYTAGGVNLGEYDQPIVSSAQGDCLEVEWEGKYFSALFIPSSNRGIAYVTIDGVSFDINTNGGITNSNFQLSNYGKNSLNPGFNLEQGSHTLRISQKNAGVNDKISVALVTVF